MIVALIIIKTYNDTKFLRENNLQAIILYPAKLSVKYKEKKKIFSDMQILKRFSYSSLLFPFKPR